MSAYIETFYDALRAAVAAVWTDTPVNGIYEQEGLDMIPFDDVSLPLAAILVPSMPKSDNWGATWNAFEPMVEIYYLSSTAGAQDTIRGKLEALRDYLLTTGLTTGQVLDVTDLCWSDELAANAVITSKNYAQGAGRVIVQCVIGEVYP